MIQTTKASAATARTQPLPKQTPETKRTSATPLIGGQYLALITPSDEGEREAQAMENFFQACSSDEPFSLELVGTRREQGFVLRASSEEQFTFLSKQMEAQYPQVEIQRIAPSADPLILHEDEHAVVGEFSLAQPSYLPLKTFVGRALSESGADPLAGLLAAMETVGGGQKIIAQFALVRAPERWLAPNIRKSVEHALQPERDKQMAARSNVNATSDTAEGIKLLGLLALGTLAYFAYRWYQSGAWLQLYAVGGVLLVGFLAFCYWKMNRPGTPVYDMKLVGEKMARAGFYAQLRVIAIGKQATSTEEQFTAYIRAMEVAYRQFTNASSNSLYLKHKRGLKAGDKRARQLINTKYAFPYGHILLRLLHGGAYSWQVLSSLELSGMFHLPQETADLPLVRRLSMKGLLASPEIAQRLKETLAPLPPALVGYSKHRRYSVPVYLPFEPLFTHKFFAGMSRSGKSVLIQLLASAAMQEVRGNWQMSTPQPGVFVIDPHRDLIMDILKLVPPSRVKDVLLLDLTDTEYPVGLNPLDASMGFTRDQAVSNLMSSFQRIWSEQWGPRMSYFLNAVCLLLYTLNELRVEEGRADEQYTLLDINPILQYRDYARKVLAELNEDDPWHQELMQFWKNTYFNLKPQFKDEIIMPIVSKIGVFNDNLQLRRIVGQSVTKAPMHEAITAGKIVLCALSAKDMDDNAVNILGSTLINLLHHSFSLQLSIPLKQRRKVFVAIDEFQNFSGSDYDKLLSEDAKYGCALLLATQSITRLNKIRDGLLEMVLANSQQLCVFRVSAADAKMMEEELQKRVTIKHILSLPTLHCYARLTLPGYPLQIVSVELAHPASWKDDPERSRLVEDIRQTNQDLCLTAAEVDELHSEHLDQFLDVEAFARELKRDARATHKKRQDDLEAEEREQDGKAAQILAAQLIAGTKQPTSPLNPTVSAEPTGNDQPAEENEESGAKDGNKAARNHRHRTRSRRLGTKHENMQGLALPIDERADGNQHALPGFGGTIAGGNSWGGISGYESREGRERG